MSLIGLLIFVIIFGVLFWAVKTLAGAFGLPAPIVQVIYVLLVLVAVLYLLQMFGVVAGGPEIRLR